MLSAMTIDTRITLRKLEIFNLVVELQSVSRAADQLYTAQPVVSAHLRSLEERVGAKLFYREGRQLHLTEAGEAAHTWAVDVLTRTMELRRHLDGLSDGSTGAVSLAASMSIGSYILPPTLSRFQKERPNVEVQLAVIDSNRAVRAAETGEYDFAIVFSERQPDNPGMAGEQIGSEQLALVARPESAAADGPISREALAQLPFVESPLGMLRRTLTERLLQRAGVPERRISIQLGHPEAMKQAIRDGVGIGLMFRSSVERELAAGALSELVVPDAELVVPIYLVHRKGKHFSAAQRDLLAAIRADLAARYASGVA